MAALLHSIHQMVLYPQFLRINCTGNLNMKTDMFIYVCVCVTALATHTYPFMFESNEGKGYGKNRVTTSSQHLAPSA